MLCFGSARGVEWSCGWIGRLDIAVPPMEEIVIVCPLESVSRVSQVCVSPEGLMQTGSPTRR